MKPINKLDRFPKAQLNQESLRNKAGLLTFSPLKTSPPPLGYDIEEKKCINISEDFTSKSVIRKIEQGLKEFIQSSTSNNRAMIIDSFKPFAYDSSLPLLQLLLDSKLAFLFTDFNEFDKEALKITIAVIERRKSSKPTGKPSKIKKHGQKEHHLQNKETKHKSIARKSQNAWLDANNMAALNYLKHTDRSNSTLQDLAKTLTNRGVLTANGKAHTPKSVSRLCERLDNHQNLFKPNLVFEEAASSSGALHGNPMSPQTKEIKFEKFRLNLGEEEVPDFKDKIVFHFKSRVNEALELSIFASTTAPDEPVFIKVINPGFDTISIDVKEETVLIPGFHYVRFAAKGYQTKWQRFTLYSEVLGN